MKKNLLKTTGILLILLAVGIGVQAWNSSETITPGDGSVGADQAEAQREASFDGILGSSANGNADAQQNLPSRKVLINNGYHTFQSFNNCGPAALSIALSYYGISSTQEALAAEIRPYNNPQGVNDDKSTPPMELADKARDYGLIPYYRGGGDIVLLKRFIALDIPVVMRTLLQADEDFAHYRVVKGYDDAAGEVVQDDSYQGKNLRYSYDDFLHLWKEFNYEYLVLVPPEKQAAVQAVLRNANALDVASSWRNATRIAEQELTENPNDVRARFNLAVALYESGEPQRAIQEFEKVESRLPSLKLWYQLQPILAYFDTGDYGRVLQLANNILANNISYSELYILRGRIYQEQDRQELARAEFEKALLYNKNSQEAKSALASLNSE